MKKTLKRLYLKINNFTNKKVKRHSLSGPPRKWMVKRKFQIEFLKTMGLSKSDRFLDIGCGTLRGGIPIIDYLDTGNYTGIDVRKIVLDEAKKELKEERLKNKSPRLIHFENIRDLNFKKKFDYIFAFAVLGHLDDYQLQSSLEFVKRHLSDTGSLFANVNIGSKPDGVWQGFPVLMRNLDQYNDFAVNCNLKVKVIGTLADFGHPSSNNINQKIMLELTHC